MKCELIGKPLGHSYSKEIHNLIAPYSYELRELDESDVSSYLQRRDFDGINVTIPYKQTVMPFLDEISEAAKKIGAVNTIVKNGGRLIGYNTDFAGMCALIRKNAISVENKTALILGTGGTSKTAAEVLKSLGAKSVVKVSRSAKDGAVSYDEAYINYSSTQIIVNTTPVGMYPHEDEQPIDLDKFPQVEAVVDAIYHPLRTNLVMQAKKRGIKASGGLYMLVAQAVYASSLFRNEKVDLSVIDSVYEKIVAQKRNIVLVGMPSSGKSTVGDMLAKATGKTFVDTDCEVVKKAAMQIVDIFEKYGEDEFRKLEREVVCKVASKSETVIATGGGVVLNPENVEKLSRNGIIVFLDRSVSELIATDDRPLARDAQAIQNLYEKRYPVYTACADIRIDADGSVEDVVKRIRSELNI